VMCFTGNGEKGHGDDHAACALRCAKEGNALGVLTPDGTVYKITGPLTADNNAKLQDLIAKQVVVTGDTGEDAEGKTLEASKVEPAKK
jgi:precorrin-6x reductase